MQIPALIAKLSITQGTSLQNHRIERSLDLLEWEWPYLERHGMSVVNLEFPKLDSVPDVFDFLVMRTFLDFWSMLAVVFKLKNRLSTKPICSSINCENIMIFRHRRCNFLICSFVSTNLRTHWKDERKPSSLKTQENIQTY